MDDVKIGEILLPGDEATQDGREKKVRSQFWPTMRRALGRVPFMRDVAAAYYCAMDRQTPARARGILLAALAYFVLPFDVVPDIFAVIGFSDDIAVLTAALAMIRTHIRQEHYDAADRMLERENLTKS